MLGHPTPYPTRPLRLRLKCLDLDYYSRAQDSNTHTSMPQYDKETSDTSSVAVRHDLHRPSTTRTSYHSTLHHPNCLASQWRPISRKATHIPRLVRHAIPRNLLRAQKYKFDLHGISDFRILRRLPVYCMQKRGERGGKSRCRIANQRTCMYT